MSDSPTSTPVTASTPRSQLTTPPSTSSSFNPPSATSLDSSQSIPLTATHDSALSSPISNVSSNRSFLKTPLSSSSGPSVARKRKNKGKETLSSSVTSLNSPITPSSSASSPISSHIPSPLGSSVSDSSEKEFSIKALRLGALYAFPAFVAIILGLLSGLVILNLTPLYNSTPLRLYQVPLYISLTALPLLSSIVVVSSTNTSLQDSISPRSCLTLVALSADVVLVFGRRIGSITGYLFGPRWGAFAARYISTYLGLWSGSMFAVLCLVYAVPHNNQLNKKGKFVDVLICSGACIAFTAHVFYAEKVWSTILSGPGSLLANHSEKSLLFICLFLTALSLLVKSPRSDSFAQTFQNIVKNHFRLSTAQSRILSRTTNLLPQSIAPLLFLLRIPLLILAIRQQVFLRPDPPYMAANGSLRVLHTSQSLSGRIVVADNLSSGYRYLRCDGSLLGGRWTREKRNGTGIEFGDSIFAAFVLQEVGILASRMDDSDSLAKTISLTSDLEISADSEERDKPQPRALIIGLGVGVSAAALSRRGYAIDIVEIDPTVYQTAKDYFDFRLSSVPDLDTINIMPAQDYIANMAVWNAQGMERGEEEIQKWSYVIHDCFSAGRLPHQVYTREFWIDLAGLVEDGGVVAVNVAGVMGSVAARRIIVTLLSVFEQCRAFGELGNEQESTGLMNMVIMCTMAQTPLLSFRQPTRNHVLRSPARTHTYTTFLQREIRLEDVILASDMENEDMVISKNGSLSGLDQISTALATWQAMQTILTREMWMAW